MVPLRGLASAQRVLTSGKGRRTVARLAWGGDYKAGLACGHSARCDRICPAVGLGPCSLTLARELQRMGRVCAPYLLGG